ncbi:MAG: hypothetical protein JXB17_06270 [Bacteroidales bacterium]|nr:hypothetical protein [Bacteroidales bacterium]
MSEKHPLKNIIESSPFLHALEYFLSLSGVVKENEYKNKVNELLIYPSYKGFTNEGDVQWASNSAEISAIYLLGEILKVNITGFNKSSPKSVKKNSNCDILGKYLEDDLYFEIKRICKEEKQILPYSLQSALDKVRGKYRPVAQLLNRNYNSINNNLIVKNIENHIRKFEVSDENNINHSVKNGPLPYSNNDIQVLFFKKGTLDDGMQFIDPVSVNDICSYLLSSDRIGKNGTPMIPMVKQAENKGADYLVCRVPDWSDYTFKEIVKKCFKEIKIEKECEYIVDDYRFGNLTGIILFNRYDKFAIINNINSKIKNPISLKV